MYKFSYLFLSSPEPVIQFSSTLYIVISHGTADGFLFYKIFDGIFYMANNILCKSVASEHSLLNRKNFSRAITCSK
jgi:hypothetical protein